MISSITLLGSSSGRNSGDAALIAAIMDGVDAACGRPLLYEIPSLRPSYIRGHYPNRVRPVGMMPWQGAVRMLGLPTARSLARTDLALVFDAILFDRSLFNPMFNFMSSLYAMLPLLRRRGKSLAGFNVGVGPVTTSAGRRMLRGIADQMAWITVRDQDSLDLLRSAGVRNPNIRLTADAALAAPSWPDARVHEAWRALGLRPGEPALGININQYIDTWASAGRVSMGREAFLATYAEALTGVADRLNVPIVFVTTQYHDLEITTELMRRLPVGVRSVLVDNRKYDHAAIKGILRQLSLLCGMRLHSIILASAEITPVVGIAYQPKVAYYFRELGQEEGALSFDAFRPDSLREHILRGWECRAELRAGLERRIPELRRRSLWSASLVAAMDRDGPAGRARAWTVGPEAT
jgi:polysaccharide pyruvyl transferase WcaK-like protein